VQDSPNTSTDLMIDEEFAQLETSILAEGCRDAIVVWGAKNIIVDGHNRFKICTDHLQPFSYVEKEFTDRTDAKVWIIRNQLARRNLTEFARAELALALKPLLLGKNRQSQKGGRGNTAEHPAHTRDELARLAGVGSVTIAKAEKIFIKGTPDLVSAARSGVVSVRSAADLVELSADEQRAVLTASEDEILKKAAEIRARRGEEKAQSRAATLYTQRQTPQVEPVIVKADAVDWLSGLGDKSVDLLLTDPPYWTHVPDIAHFAAGWLPLALDKLKDTGRAYVFIGYYAAELAAYLSLILAQTRFNYDLLAWTYRNTLGPQPVMSYKKNLQSVIYLWGKKAVKLESPSLTEQFSVADVSAPDGRHGTRLYRWEKPYDLAERYIRHSTTVGDVVADPFVGSGTFVLAAGNLGRKGIGCDNDDAALTIARERLCGEAAPLDTLSQPAASALKLVGSK